MEYRSVYEHKYKIHKQNISANQFQAYDHLNRYKLTKSTSMI